ncbi:MscL family protein [Candidatus Saccharibacteria bacterium TM7i]|nr:MscL family protein [Candidatus Saccharibacteria bacterium TM7i]
MAQKKDSKTEAKTPAAKRRALRNQAKHRVEAAATESAQKVSSHFNGFVEFIKGQGIIGLAVGLAIGTAAGDTVKKLVEGFINPIVQFIVGSQAKLSTATWTFEAFGRSADFAWGAALSSAITLVATALVVYWLVSLFKLEVPKKK